MAELDRVVNVEEFLYALPRRLFAGLRTAAVAPDSVLRDVVGAMVQLATATAAEAALYEASPGEFREDLADLLTAIETQALSAALPGFVPAGADIRDLLVRGARVRQGLRADRARQEDRDEEGLTHTGS